MIHVLDLHFHTPQAIAAFVVESSEGPILVETGPHSTFPKLEEDLQKIGYKVSDISHVFLTHIHFDHAGSAWAFAEAGATVYVHPVGYPHLLDPSRLYNSAKRIYGDMMEKLWGMMKPIPASQLVSVEDNAEWTIGGHTFKALYTPGHATHHIAWQMGDSIFTGDVAGCTIDGGPVVPPCPPPDINIEDWFTSIDLVLSHNPKTIYLTHFGEVTTIDAHMKALKQVLTNWSQWVKPHWEAGKKPAEITADFQGYVRKGMEDFGLTPYQVNQYEAANPPWMSVAGLMRYWKKRAERETGEKLR